MTAAPGLIADIGGTNARFALVGADGEAERIIVLRCADHADPYAAAAAFLAKVRPALPPDRAAFAVASPVTDDVVDLTNHPWRFSIEDVRRRLGLRRLAVVNDFTAVALGIPHLDPRHRIKVGGGEPAAGMPIAALGPGTGLGVSGLIPAADGTWIALASEGGHSTLPACNEREDLIISRLRALYGHVSAERALSGPGLVNLYTALAMLDGQPVTTPPSPATVSRHALDGTSEICRLALDTFFAMLGTVASNLALSLGARGGVYIAGGIVPSMTEALTASDFRRRFEDKGRFDDYLADIPVYIVTHPYPAFPGLAELVNRRAD